MRALQVAVSFPLCVVEGPNPAQGRRENTTGSGTRSMTLNYLIYMLEKPFEMESLLTLIRHLLAFELTRFFLFPPPINKIAMEEARWGDYQHALSARENVSSALHRKTPPFFLVVTLPCIL